MLAKEKFDGSIAIIESQGVIELFVIVVPKFVVGVHEILWEDGNNRSARFGNGYS